VPTLTQLSSSINFSRFVLPAVCMQKFPNVTRGQLGVAVNGKLTELRLKARKVMETSKSDNLK
jgi:hypothetical protein